MASNKGQPSEEHKGCEEGPRKDIFQGPHNWRRTLKSVKDQDSEQEEQSESQVERVPKTRRPSTDDKAEETRIRERLRNLPAWKKDTVERKQKGPMVAKHNSVSTTSSNVNSNSTSPSPAKRRYGSGSSTTESPFTRQVVNRASSPSTVRRRLHAPHPSGRPAHCHAWGLERKGSMSGSHVPSKRVPSPNMPSEVGQVSTGDSMKKRVEKVMKARLYLLQQMGPNSFLIGGDSPDHKYRVVIGQQRCSCGRGPHCVHILFVMLRVFQLSETDPELWAKTLKNYEVEGLFRDFHERRTSLIKNLGKKKKKMVKKQESEEKEKEDVNNAEVASNTENEEEEDELGMKDEDTCPICLLEMVEGESLTECVNGCQNKLHHHCIAIWFEECRRMGEVLNCPLCRAEWRTSELESSDVASAEELPVPPNTRVSSPTPSVTQEHADIMLPHAEPIPPEHMTMARLWIPVIGEDLVSCLFSKNWVTREIALKQLGQIAMGCLILGVGEGRTHVVLSSHTQATTHSMLECCCSVLACMCADPVYKVFVAGLRTLRTILAYTPCRDAVQQTRLQAIIKPIVETILWKCADSNKRTSQLSISALQELVKGQEGELAVGREIANPGSYYIGDLSFLLDCMNQEYDPSTVQWQWLLGRLCMLLKLIEEHPTEFLIKVPKNIEGVSCEEYPNYIRVMAVLKFIRYALDNSHQKVSKIARRVFYLIARMQAQNATLLKQVMDMLDGLDLNLQVHLRRRLLHMAAEFQVAQQVVGLVHQGSTESLPAEDDLRDDDDDDSPPPFATPIMSATSTPRSGTPEPTHQITVTVNNYVTGNLNFVPVAPPNSPRRRGSKKDSKKNRTSGNEADVESVASSTTSLYDAGSSADELSDTSRSHVPPSPLVRQPLEPIPSSPPPAYTEHDASDISPRTVGSEHEESLDPQESNKVDACTSTSPSLSSIAGLFERPVQPELVRQAHTKPRSQSDAAVYAKTAANRRQARLTHNESVQTEPEDSDGIFMFPPDDRSRESSTDPSFLSGEEDNAEERRSKLDRIRRTPAEGDITEESGVDSDEGILEEADASDDAVSTSATAASATVIMLTGDLSDMTLSPSMENVSFKTEVASSSSPQHKVNQDTSPGSSQNSSGDADCHCKEEVEKEEAQALVAALEQSNIQQGHLPYVPGLSKEKDDETLTIHIQDEADYENDPQPHDYLEGIHWQRGPMLGTGAFSTCYQARDVKTGTIMCVKQISFCRNSLSEQDTVVETVEEEIQMMSRLNHPHVVRILGATRQGCHFFMFVEWMPGGSVASLLSLYGAFKEDVIVNYTRQILQGLAYLHENHTLHRDLKGANLLVDSTGQRIRIGDFGAAARLASRATMAGEFQGQLLGTIAFMAPEVLRGESYGRSCDVWSVGCTMIEMATRKPPWGAHDISNHLALIFKIASTVNPPPIPDNLSPPVRDLLLRCLECQREDRPPAKELLKHPLFTMHSWPKR